jgi:hypothetical protein
MPRIWAGFSTPWLNLLNRREALRQRHIGSLFFSECCGRAVNSVLRSSLKMER